MRRWNSVLLGLRTFVDVELAGFGDGLGAAGHIQLFEDVVQVALDRSRGEHEAVGDLRVGETLDDQAENLDLPRAEQARRFRIFERDGSACFHMGGGREAGQDPVDGFREA